MRGNAGMNVYVEYVPRRDESVRLKRYGWKGFGSLVIP